MPRLKNTERELLQKAVTILTRKAEDRSFAAKVLKGVLDDDNRVGLEGRMIISRTATQRHAKEKAQQSQVVAMPSKKKAA